MIPRFFTISVRYDIVYNENCEIYIFVRHGNAVFGLCYDPQVLASSPSLLEQHHEAYKILYADLLQSEKKEVLERLIPPFKELIMNLARGMDVFVPTEYLNQYLYLPYILLDANLEDGGSDIKPRFRKQVTRGEMKHSGEYTMHLRNYLPPLLDLVDQYSSDLVQILDHTLLWVPSRVRVGDDEYFFKAWQSRPGDTYHELRSYKKILTAIKTGMLSLADTRICYLRGLIIDNDDECLQHYPIDSDMEYEPESRLVGLLLNHIENQGTLRELAPWTDCTDEDRSRWSTQIRDTVDRLHKAGIVWGDVKPDNVLIDLNGDAWIIDFGGSRTEGWVDGDKQESVEGDLQGMQKIMDWLEHCSKQPLDRIRKAPTEQNLGTRLLNIKRISYSIESTIKLMLGLATSTNWLISEHMSSLIIRSWP